MHLHLMSLRAVLEPASMAILLTVAYKISLPLGGIIYMLLSLTQRLRVVGRAFSFIYLGPIKFAAAAKLIGWTVSASGLLLGYLAQMSLWGPPHYRADYWVIAIIASAALLNHFYDMMFYEFPTYQEIMEYSEQAGVSARLGVSLASLDPREGQKTARSAVTDNLLPPLLKMLVSIGFLYFSIGQLHLVILQTPAPPTLAQSLSIAFSPTSLIDKPAVPFTGTLWTCVHTAGNFMTFFAFGTFIGGASSIFLEKLQTAPTPSEGVDAAGISAMVESAIQAVARSGDVREQTRSGITPARATEPDLY